MAPLPVRVELPPGTPPVKGKAIRLREELLQSHRPYVASVFSYSNEPLDNFNNKLATVTPGLEAGFYPTHQTQLQFNYLPTVFGLSNPRIGGQEWRLTMRSEPTTRFRYVTSLGLFNTFHNVRSGLAVIGNTGGVYTVNDRLRLGYEYRRDIVGDSRLSATGLDLPINGDLVGRIKRNKFSIGVSSRPLSRTDVDFRYSAGFDAGHKVITNPFYEFTLRVGQTVVAREAGAHLQLLQPSYLFLVTGFRRDLSEFGNLTLTPSNDFFLNKARLESAAAGNPNLPVPPGDKQAGVGGYFSPQKFFLHSFRLDASGRLVGPVSYKLGGSIGIQDFKNNFTNLGHPGIVGTANASLVFRAGRHVTMEQGWYYLQAANTYQRNVIYNTFRYTF